jgi:hypothetical protein
MIILFDLPVSHIHIQLGGSYTGVPKHFLNRGDWHLSCNHAAGKCVSQLVAGNPNIRLAAILSQLQLNTSYRDRLSSPVQEHLFSSFGRAL